MMSILEPTVWYPLKFSRNNHRHYFLLSTELLCTSLSFSLALHSCDCGKSKGSPWCLPTISQSKSSYNYCWEPRGENGVSSKWYSLPGKPWECWSLAGRDNNCWTELILPEFSIFGGNSTNQFLRFLQRFFVLKGNSFTLNPGDYYEKYNISSVSTTEYVHFVVLNSPRLVRDGSS